LVVLPGGTAGTGEGFVAVEGLPLGFGALKQADAGKGLILRVYEPHGARGKARLRFATAPKRVERVNLLEEKSTAGSTPKHDGNAVTLDMRPFEVTTLRLVF
jgi:alpha-mannosidase